MHRQTPQDQSYDAGTYNSESDTLLPSRSPVSDMPYPAPGSGSLRGGDASLTGGSNGPQIIAPHVPPSDHVSNSFANAIKTLQEKDVNQEIYFGMKMENWHRLGKVGNGVYALVASSVFALMSYFREEGVNTFDHYTFWGMVNMICSLLVNLPMAYFFSDRLFKLLDDVLHPNDPAKKGNWYYTLSFIFGVLFGGGTTFAGIALSNISLTKWSPTAPAAIITALFAWNTFSTRAMSVTSVLYALSKSAIKLRSRYLPGGEPIIKLLNDLNRFGPRIGRISSTKLKELKTLEIEWKKQLSDKALSKEVLKQSRLEINGKRTALLSQINKDLVESFYRILQDKGFTEKPTWSERALNGVSTTVSIILSLLALDSIVLWLNLTGQGLDQSGGWFGYDSWGESAPAAYLCMISHLALYVYSSWCLPDTYINEVYYRPELQNSFTGDRYATSKRLGVAAGTFIFFSALGYPSGAGYALTGSTVASGDMGSVPRALLESDVWLAKVYQAWFNFLKPSWADPGYAGWFYYLMSGSVVNGSSATKGYLEHSFDSLKIRCLFNEPDSGVQPVVGVNTESADSKENGEERQDKMVEAATYPVLWSVLRDLMMLQLTRGELVTEDLANVAGTQRGIWAPRKIQGSDGISYTEQTDVESTLALSYQA